MNTEIISSLFNDQGFSVGRTEILFVKNQKKRGYVDNFLNFGYLKLEEPNWFAYFVLHIYHSVDTTGAFYRVIVRGGSRQRASTVDARVPR